MRDSQQRGVWLVALCAAAAVAVTGCGRRSLVVVSQDGTEVEGEEGGEGGEGDAAPGDGGGGAQGGDDGPAGEEGDGGDAGAGPEGGGDQAGSGDEGGPGEVGEGDDGGEGPPPVAAYCAGVDACREDKAAAGPDAEAEYTWCSHVRGLLQSQAAACNTCHSGGAPASGWIAQTYETVFGDGVRDPDKSVVEPCCGDSELINAASGADGFFAHDGKIVGADLKTIQDWITRDGAPKGEGCD